MIFTDIEKSLIFDDISMIPTDIPFLANACTLQHILPSSSQHPNTDNMLTCCPKLLLCHQNDNVQKCSKLNDTPGC